MLPEPCPHSQAACSTHPWEPFSQRCSPPASSSSASPSGWALTQVWDSEKGAPEALDLPAGRGVGWGAGGACQRNAVELLGFQGNCAGPRIPSSASWKRPESASEQAPRSSACPRRLAAGGGAGTSPPPHPTPAAMACSLEHDWPLRSAQSVGRGSPASTRRQRQATGPLHR